MKIGQKVTYVSPFRLKYDLRDQLTLGDKGIIKSIEDDIAYVVFNCGNNWDNYMNYTGEQCRLSSLRPGWWVLPEKPEEFFGSNEDWTNLLIEKDLLSEDNVGALVQWDELEKLKHDLKSYD